MQKSPPRFAATLLLFHCNSPRSLLCCRYSNSIVSAALFWNCISTLFLFPAIHLVALEIVMSIFDWKESLKSCQGVSWTCWREASSNSRTGLVILLAEGCLCVLLFSEGYNLLLSWWSVCNACTPHYLLSLVDFLQSMTGMLAWKRKNNSYGLLMLAWCAWRSASHTHTAASKGRHLLSEQIAKELVTYLCLCHVSACQLAKTFLLGNLSPVIRHEQVWTG